MRSFFCFELPQRAKEEIGNTIESIDSPALVKWVETENLHITLKFLGDIGQEDVSRLRTEGEQVAKEGDPFEITLDKLGAFPNPNFPKVLWLGSRSEGREIHRIQNNLEEKLAKLGFDKERREYIPHVTLGRTKEEDESKIEQLGSKLKHFQLDKKWELSINTITLMESKLTRKGPIYNPVFQLSLESS